MWSGPRNISTAMLRSWGQRSDTVVCDEPLYAYYLERTKLDHPGATEVIEHHETDPAKVIAWLTGPLPRDRTVFYQKHMAHHLLPDLDRDWLHQLTNCFLIRDPAAMVLSLSKVLPEPRLIDTGLPQQVEIFELIRSTTSEIPPVLDSRDVLEDPAARLSALCDRVGLKFDDSMLSWPAGSRDTDGVWAKHWYASVEASTAFAPYRPKDEPLPSRLEPLVRECQPYYDRLAQHRIQ